MTCEEALLLCGHVTHESGQNPSPVLRPLRAPYLVLSMHQYASCTSAEGVCPVSSAILTIQYNKLHIHYGCLLIVCAVRLTIAYQAAFFFFFV